ncbi:MAG: recombinase family protein [Flavobacteriales bacterium]|nr:recombinase family protein [Flavobacteriales bacterium]
MSKLKVGIWMKVSTDKQVGDDEAEEYEKQAQAYAESKGWEVIKTYHYEGFDEKKALELEETNPMFNDVANGVIDCVIFSKLTQFAHSTAELIDLVFVLHSYHAKAVFLEESIDTTTDSGKVFLATLAAIESWEKEGPNQLKLLIEAGLVD